MSPAAIIRVQSDAEVDRIARLARNIWTQHYASIIGLDQVAYMLNKYQSTEAIRSQIESGFHYVLLTIDQRDLAYLALVPEGEAVMISKLYVHEDARGRGLGKQLMERAGSTARTLGGSQLWLTVNRGNFHSIEWYKRQGFTLEREQVVDIGGGYVMDDYIMSRSVSHPL